MAGPIEVSVRDYLRTELRYRILGKPKDFMDTTYNIRGLVKEVSEPIANEDNPENYTLEFRIKSDRYSSLEIRNDQVNIEEPHKIYWHLLDAQDKEQPVIVHTKGDKTPNILYINDSLPQFLDRDMHEEFIRECAQGLEKQMLRQNKHL